MDDTRPKGVPNDGWEFYNTEVFDHYEINSELGLTGKTLLQLNAKGSIRGNFKFLLDGSDPIEVIFPASKILEIDGANDYQILIEVWPRDIKLKINSLASEWSDLTER